MRDAILKNTRPTRQQRWVLRCDAAVPPHRMCPVGRHGRRGPAGGLEGASLIGNEPQPLCRCCAAYLRVHCPSDASARRRDSKKEQNNVIELSDQSEESPEDSDASTADDPISAGLAEIRGADSSFQPAEFLDGARGAFEYILQAFATEDLVTLKNLLNDEVFDNFNAAIQARQKAGETLESTIVGIKSTDYLEAQLEGRTAFITVKFVSEQVNVTRDGEGNVTEGDSSKVSEVTDIWTFAHNTRSRNPNWTLVGTRSPN